MAKLISPRLATPSCAKPFTCPPLSLGAGANLSSPGLLCWRGANCPISPFEAPLCVNSFTSPLASSNTKQHSTLHWSFCPKLFDFQDPIYGANPSIMSRGYKDVAPTGAEWLRGKSDM